MNHAIAVQTIGSTASRAELGPGIRVSRLDSFDLTAFGISREELAEPIRLGLIDHAVVEALLEGRGPAWLQAVLAGWIDRPKGRIRYLPTPLGPAGGDGTPAQVAIACARLEGQLFTMADGLVTMANGGREAPAVRMTLPIATLGRTTGRGALIPVLDSIQRAHARLGARGQISLPIVVLAGLSDPDPDVVYRSLGGTTASLLELSAVQARLRATLGQPIGHLSFGQAGRLADHVLLVEPTAAGLRNARELETWLADLITHALAVRNGSAVLDLLADLPVWTPLSLRSSPAGLPTIFSSLGFAIVELDLEAEAWRLAARDCRTVFDLLLAAADDPEPPALDDIVAGANGEPLELLIGSEIDPNGTIDADVPLPALDILPAPTLDELAAEDVRVLHTDPVPAQVAELLPDVHLATFDTVRTGLAQAAAQNPLVLGRVMRALAAELNERAKALLAEADAEVISAEDALGRARQLFLGAERPPAQRAYHEQRRAALAVALRARRRQARAQRVADAIMFVAERMAAAEGPDRIAEALRTLIATGAAERDIERRRPARSTAVISLLEPFGDAVYERLGLARGRDGSLNADLVATLLAEQGLTDAMLRTLSERDRPDYDQDALSCAGAIVDGLRSALEARHRRTLAGIRTIPDALRALDADGGLGLRQRLRDLYSWADKRAEPPVNLRDPGLLDAPEPRSWIAVEVDSRETAELLADLLPAGRPATVSPPIAGDHRPARLLILRARACFSADLLENFFGPASAGWLAYQRFQRAWETGGDGRPIHTLPVLEALARDLLHGAHRPAGPPPGPERPSAPVPIAPADAATHTTAWSTATRRSARARAYRRRVVRPGPPSTLTVPRTVRPPSPDGALDDPYGDRLGGASEIGG